MEDDALLKRTVPHSVEAEKAVIGSILIDQDKMEEVAEILTGEDFYTRSYALVFDAMMALYNDRRPIDSVTLENRIKEMGAPEGMDSTELFRDILQSVYTSANARAYAQIVYEKSTLRKLIKASEDIANECYEEALDLETILADSEKSIFDVVKSRNSKESVPINQMVMKALSKIEEASQIKGNITGLPSGFTDLDKDTSGFQPSDFILIAARPSMGKTAFALSIADNVVIRQNKAVAIFSLEMSSEQLLNRLFSMEARIDAQDLRSGNLSDQEWIDLAESSEEIAKSRLIIDDTPGITISELRSKCRKYKLEQDIQLVVIDYIQLMSSGVKTDNRQQEISDISRAIKGIARELNIPVIVLSQLNRAADARTDKRPMLSDIRESGAIEQDADLIMFLYREDYYDKETENKNVVEVIIAKQRNGPTGTVKLTWQPKYTRFVNAARPSGGSFG